MPRLWRSQQLPWAPYAASAKYSWKRQTSRVLRQSRRVSYWTIQYRENLPITWNRTRVVSVGISKLDFREMWTYSSVLDCQDEAP